MPGDVVFRVDAQTSKAVQGVLNIVNAQGRAVDGFKGMREHAQHAHGATEALTEAAHEMIAEFMSIEAVKDALEQTWQSIEKGTEKVKAFYKSAAGAESLPRYLEDNAGFVQRSSALSTAYGQKIEDVNKLREQIAIGVSPDTPDATVRQYEDSALRTQKFTGAAPETVFQAEKKLRETYPQLSVPGAENSVEFMRERGGMNAEQFNQFLDTTLPGFQMMKTPLRDVEALASVSARAGADISPALKQLMLKLPELSNPDRKGGAVITHGDSLEGIVGDLQKAYNENPAQFVKDVGRRAAPGVAYLVNHPEAIAQARQQVDTFGTGAIKHIEESREQDPRYRAAHLNEQIETARDNVVLEKTTAGQMDLVNNTAIRELGAQQQLPQWASWAAKPKVWKDKFEKYVLGRTEHADEDEAAGRLYIQRKNQEANPGGAEDRYLKYEQGVQKQIRELTSVPVEQDWSDSLQKQAFDAANKIGSAGLFQSSQQAGAGDTAAAAKTVEDTFNKLNQVIQKLDAVADKHQKAADTHIVAANATKQAADAQQRGQRKVNSH